MLTRLLGRLDPAARRALADSARNAALSFVVLFGGALVGWLDQFARWASSSGQEPLPGVGSLGYALLSAGAAAGTGLVTFLVDVARARRAGPEG